MCTTCCLPAQCIYILYYSDIRSRWPRRLRGLYAAARMLGLRVRIPKGGMDVCCAGSVLCDGPITRPGESQYDQVEQ